MKAQIAATVVGNRLKRPDPKNAPLTWVGLVDLEVAARATLADKPTKAVLVVDVDEMNSQFRLGSKLRITIEDVQQELEFESESIGADDHSDPASIRGPRKGSRGRRGGILTLPGTQD